MNLNYNVFKLYANCIIVKGYYLSTICDLHLHRYITIPNHIACFLKKEKALHEIEQTCSKTDYKNILKFFHYLKDKDYGIWCETKKEAKRFIDFPLKWDSPYSITNLILDISKKNINSIQAITNSLNTLKIQHLLIRSYIKKDFLFYIDFINNFNFSFIDTIQLAIPYDSSINVNSVKTQKSIQNQIRINNIIFYNSPYDKTKGILDDLTLINYSTKSIDSIYNCKSTQNTKFHINIPFFTESQEHNTCLNRKLSIDKNGYIRNCPNMKQCYGHIEKNDLQRIIESEKFQYYWKIKKDDIDICKDCEYRHLCMDCRAFISIKNNIFSKPIKCTYNPYICKWGDEDGYVPVEKCGYFNLKNKFIPNHKKINEINKELWD